MREVSSFKRLQKPKPPILINDMKQSKKQNVPAKYEPDESPSKVYGNENQNLETQIDDNQAQESATNQKVESEWEDNKDTESQQKDTMKPNYDSPVNSDIKTFGKIFLYDMTISRR